MSFLYSSVTGIHDAEAVTENNYTLELEVCVV